MDVCGALMLLAYLSIRLCVYGQSNLIIFNWISSKFHIRMDSYHQTFAQVLIRFGRTNDKQDG